MKQFPLLLLVCISLIAKGQLATPEVNCFKLGNFHLSQGNIKPSAANFPSSLIALMDSIYSWRLDTLNNVWNVKFKTINIIYDVNNNKTSELNQQWISNAWDNYGLSSYTYDSSNNQASDLSQLWNGTTWDNFTIYNRTFDGNNNITSQLFKFSSLNVWVNQYLYTYTYDTNNNLISNLFQQWNVNAWVNQYLYTYNYDLNNNPTSSLFKQWTGSVWENDQYYSDTFDANNNLISSLRQEWYGNAWNNSTLYNYIYDANNNQVSVLEQLWNGSWINSGQSTSTYDANNNQTSILNQSWNGNVLKSINITFFTYDADNFLKSKVLKWFDSTGVYINFTDSTHFYFHTVLSTNELTNQNENIITYPNPFTDVLKIRINIITNNIGEAVLLDALGKEILRVKITKSETILDTEKLPSGFYLLMYMDGNKTTIAKLLKF